MSEITTGAVPLALIGAPLAIPAACIGAIYFAGKYCVKQYENLMHEIERGNERLKWLDKQVLTSPIKMREEALKLHKMVAQNKTFNIMTQGLSKAQKHILAGAIVTQNSPLKAYVPKIMQNIPESENAFETALIQGTKNLAVDNMKFVNSIVKKAAEHSGFNKDIKILRNTDSLFDVVFIDNQNRRLTAYCKMDKQLNPSLAIDFEGFNRDRDECTSKMDEIVKYLQEHGVPFKYDRIKHNQPLGILRNVISQRRNEVNSNELNDYLKGGNSGYNQKLNSKNYE